jgi:CHASE2 domain-containing sensor protein
MDDTGNQESLPPSRQKRGVWQHICEEWQATVFVVAVVTIIHTDYGWFDAVDRSALLIISHLSAFDGEGDSKSQDPKVVILGIDDKTHEEIYFERSPLDRCALLSDLKVIYENKPRLLAIDLDLSPPIWMEKLKPKESASERQVECQKQLYSLIKSNAGSNVKTVLMAPFNVSGHYMAGKKDWMNKMQEKGVHFGNATLPVEHGLVLHRYIHPQIFSTVVYCLEKYGQGGNPDKKKDSVCLVTPESQSSSASDPLDQLINFDSNVPSVKTGLINFQSYVASGMTTRTTTLPELKKTNKASSALNDKIVFFGARYGQDDSFLTVLGNMYGVDIHTAAYLSASRGIDELEDQHGHTWKLIIELVYAFSLGIVISYFWKHYFELNASTSAMRRQIAAVYLAGLVITFSVLLVLLCATSLEVMKRYAIWLSPVPIAVGMLVESFVSGSVIEATCASRKTNWPSKPCRRLLYSFAKFFVLDCKRLWQKEDVLADSYVSPQRESVVTIVEKAQIQPEIVLNISQKRESIIRIYRGPWNKVAAVLIGIRRCIWLWVIVYAYSSAH